MTAVVIALAILALVPVILFWPHVGILMWFWIGLMNPHRWIWGDLEVLGYAQIIALTTLAAWMISREPKRIALTPVTALMALFMAWVTLTTATAHVPGQAWIDWTQAFKIMLMTWVTIALINSRERLHALIWVAVLSLGFYGAKGGVFTILTGGEARVWGPPQSFIESNNQLALALIMTVPLMLYLRSQTENAWIRFGLAGLAAVSVFSIIGTQSRGAFVAVVVMAVFLIIKSKHRLSMGAGVLAMALIGLMFVPDTWVARMETIQNYDQDASALGRLAAWQFAIEVARMYPLTGGGFNVFLDSDLWYRLVPGEITPKNFHSVYFEVLGEQGFIGLILFMSLLATAWFTFSRIMRRTKHRGDLMWAHELARMAQVSLIGYAAAGSFLNLAFYDLYYLVLAIAVISGQIVSRQLAGEAAPRRSHAPAPDPSTADAGAPPWPGDAVPGRAPALPRSREP